MAFPPFDNLSSDTSDSALTVLSMIVQIDENRAHERYRSKQLNMLVHQFDIMSDRIIFAAIISTFAEHVEAIHSTLSSMGRQGHDHVAVNKEELTMWSEAFSKVDLLAKVANVEQRTLSDDYVTELYERFKMTFEKLGGDFYRALDESELERIYNPEIWKTNIFRMPTL